MIALPRRHQDTSPLAAAGPTRPLQDPSAGTDTMLEVRRATRRYDDTVALDDVSITARKGEFLSLLGPSGAGKTTLLRIVAGLDEPTSIEALRIAGQDVRALPANRRDVATVFQHYALFPHMSVLENIEYGLRVRGIKGGERRARARDLITLLQLDGLGRRRPHQLSAGQRQRVALARALAPRPALLLLDEPLGALDERLREDVQIELLELQRSLEMTFVYVTHSRAEALMMSDRVAIMHAAEIVQVGEPADLFDRPRTRFVADFVGIENVLDGTFEGIDGEVAAVRYGDRVLRGVWHGDDVAKPGDRVAIAVRAAAVRLGTAERGDENELPARVVAHRFKGGYAEVVVDTCVGPVKASVHRELGHVLGTDAVVSWAAGSCIAVRCQETSSEEEQG